MRRKQLTPLVFILVTAVAALGAVFATGTTPQLGLDLQGGISVVLQPTKESSDEALSQTIEIIRSRVDALGVAEPEIARQGNAVVVQLPGVENQQRALELVGDTAELRFRPVLLSVPKAQLDALEDATTTTTAGDGTTTTTTTAPGETTTTAESTTTTAAP
jgi:preprotein translocase subunit SecD